ncbi:Uncharacterized protein Fot_31793 [Forsythia ovata]|uniref:Uncharacterized protein n=1 Tax=Forsythia ovata TaxID=205694 RepID=A0ABD1T5Y5_9LAMI
MAQPYSRAWLCPWSGHTKRSEPKTPWTRRTMATKKRKSLSQLHRWLELAANRGSRRDPRRDDGRDETKIRRVVSDLIGGQLGVEATQTNGADKVLDSFKHFLKKLLLFWLFFKGYSV